MLYGAGANLPAATSPGGQGSEAVQPFLSHGDVTTTIIYNYHCASSRQSEVTVEAPKSDRSSRQREVRVEAPKPDRVTSTRMYDVLQAAIKDTDEISFKLLGRVPLVNGGALLTAVLGIRTSEAPAPGIIVLALFGALVTLGLFWWELRNIRYCLWYIALAEHFEATWPECLRRFRNGRPLRAMLENAKRRNSSIRQ
jgi:hypothetical protein